MYGGQVREVVSALLEGFVEGVWDVSGWTDAFEAPGVWDISGWTNTFEATFEGFLKAVLGGNNDRGMTEGAALKRQEPYLH